MLLKNKNGAEIIISLKALKEKCDNDMLMLTGCGKDTPLAQQPNVQSVAQLGQIEITAPEKVCITISAIGDVTMRNYIEQGYSNSFDQTYELQQDKSYFLENVKDIFRKDDLTEYSNDFGVSIDEKGVLGYQKILERGGAEFE